MLADYYTIPLRIKELEDEIDRIHQQMDVKAVQFDSLHCTSSKTSDERLLNMTSKIMIIESSIMDLRDRQFNINSKLHIKELNKKQSKILDAVFTSNTYKDAAETTGYSVKQVYRTINDIYEFMEQFV